MAPELPHKLLLGVNIDHVATLRQARGTDYPSITEATRAAEAGGADAITIHLREDRRHIQDADLPAISEVLTTRMNLELAVTNTMLDIALETSPADVCLVPERREELTTEGGLDVRRHARRITDATRELQKVGTRVSLFIDPDGEQLQAARDCGVEAVELHTGEYANQSTADAVARELQRIIEAATLGHSLGLQVNAGHGLHYQNTQAIAAIPEIVELNIGHAIIARSVFIGLQAAVREMRVLMDQAR